MRNSRVLLDLSAILMLDHHRHRAVPALMHPQSSRLSNLAARRAASCLSVSALLTKEIEASANDLNGQPWKSSMKSMQDGSCSSAALSFISNIIIIRMFVVTRSSILWLLKSSSIHQSFQFIARII